MPSVPADSTTGDSGCAGSPSRSSGVLDGASGGVPVPEGRAWLPMGRESDSGLVSNGLMPGLLSVAALWDNRGETRMIR